MSKTITLLFSIITLGFLNANAQCTTNAISGNYTINSNTTLNAGTYNITGDFAVTSGVTLTVNYSNGCAFTVNANNITISGTIDANGSGGQGGGGGGAGSSSGGPGGGTQADGGGGGSAGGGTGGGNIGFSGGNATGGCSINCGSFICTGGNDADRAGAGGGSGGSGGSFGGSGGTGGTGANGRMENEPGNSDCGVTPNPGNGAVANSATTTYNTIGDASNLPTGSGGGGAGGGGGGYGNGTAGGNGGNGGGAVNLNATGNLTVGGVISANGTNGAVGGNGGVRSGGGDYNCDNCSNNDGGGSNTCRDATDCTCTYYTWSWPGGAGGGAGGGSGGGIKLQAIGVMSITGALTANGGNGGNSGSPKLSDGSCNHYASGGGAGAGGIIKLVYDPCANNTFTATAMTASAGTPGLGTDGNISTNTAAPGLVYNQSANIYFPGYTPFATPTVSASQTLCSGNVPATLTSAGVSGGTGTFNYQWFSSTTNPLGQTGSTPTPANGWAAISGSTGATLAGSTIGAIGVTTYYQLLVQSGPCYVWTNVVTITITPTPIINSATVVNELCNGGSNGSISVSLAGGTQPYSYSDNGGSTYQLNNVFSGLTATTYNLYVKDANGCPVVYGANPITIQQPTALTQTDTAINASCNNVNNGSIIVTANGGTAPYQYSLNGGANQLGNGFFGQSAGTYTVQVTDANGCSSTASVTVDTAYAVTASLVSKTNVSCFEGSDGSATLLLTGGLTPYSYSINGVTFQSGPTFTGLTAGNYIGTIKDANGCTDFVLVQITQPNLLQVQIDTLVNVSCHDSSTGAIYLGVTGGTGPYSFHWSNNDSTQDIINITAGTYNVTVVDANGCNSFSGTTVAQPLALFVNIASYHNLHCFNDSTGSIETAASGGTPPYSFAWSNTSTYQNIYALQQGTYTLTVHDASGCVDTLSQVLIQPTQLVPTISGTNVTCGNTANGAVDFSLTGGTPPYSYIWNNGSSAQNLSNIGGGIYLVTAHDANGCAVYDTITITGAASPIVANLASVSPSCHGTSTGTIIAVVTGGVEPFAYTWNTAPVRTTAAINNLGAGIYTLTVVDAIGCSVIVTDTLSQTDSLTVNASVNGAKCFNTSSGSVIAVTTGGVAPFTYLVNGMQQTSDTFSNLSAGNYSVLVLDGNGCQAASSFIVASPSSFSVKLSLTEQSILTNQQTQLVATPTSNSAVIGYIWTPIVENGADIFSYGSCTDTANCSTPYVKPPFTTTFAVQMINADSCIASDTITVNVTNQPVSFIPTAFTPNNDGLNDRFQFAILGANTTEVSIYNRWGEKLYYNANQTNSVTGTDGWDGTIKGKEAPEDTYAYQIKVTYFDGTVKNISGTVTLIR